MFVQLIVGNNNSHVGFHLSVGKEKINFYDISLIYSHSINLLIWCDMECFELVRNAFFICSYSCLSALSEYSATSTFAIP